MALGPSTGTSDRTKHPGLGPRPRRRDYHQPSFASLGIPLIETTFVVLDLETTGLRPDTDAITEIGAVKVRGGERLGEFATLVRPPVPVPASITALTGISQSMVRSAPRIEELLDILLEFLGDGVFVAHNARFDLSFLRASLARAGHPPYEPRVVDTARLARRLLRDELRDVRLATLARHLGARVRPDHRALTDARATVDVLHALLERAGPLGATTLEDLVALEHARSSRRFRRMQLVRQAPAACGIYRFVGPDGEVLYVGKATDLRSRLRTYFTSDPRRHVEQLVRDTERVHWTVTPTVLEAEIRELRAIRTHRPRYNRRSTHPAPAVYLALTDEPFPRLSVVRQPGPKHRHVLGPFPSRSRALIVAEAMTRQLGLRTCNDRLRAAQDHAACMLKAIGRCDAPCDGTQSRAIYSRLVESAAALMADPSTLVASLAEQMDDEARMGRYELAASTRTALHSVAQTAAFVRHATALHAAGQLVVAGDHRDTREVLVISQGRLAATARLPAGTPDAMVIDHVALLPHDLLPETGADAVTPVACDAAVYDTVAESRLVLAAIARPGMRIVAASEPFSEPVPGGRIVADMVRQARRVSADLRRDRSANASGDRRARR